MQIHEYTGEEVKAIRLGKGENQTLFWARFLITQSGGSRYESGRDIPYPVQILLNIALQPVQQSDRVVKQLRDVPKRAKAA